MSANVEVVPFRVNELGFCPRIRTERVFKREISRIASKGVPALAELLAEADILAAGDLRASRSAVF